MDKTILLLPLLALAVVCSCEHASFLDRTPYTQTSPENFFKTETDFKLATIGAYEAMNTNVSGGANNNSVSGGTYYCGLPVIMNSPSDELLSYNTAADSYGQFTQMTDATFSESTTGLRRMWDAFYAGINRCNSVIYNAEGKDSEVIAGYVAEVRFLRALYYWYLAQTFGAVPIVSYHSDGMEARSGLQDVYGYILDDLQAAYEGLPAVKGRGAVGAGSATKYTAAAYIGKICNYLAACKRSGAGAELVEEQPLNDFSWVNAEDMSRRAYTSLKDVVDNAPYTLIEDFTNLFRETTKDDQHEECLLMAENYLDGTEGAFPPTTMFALSPGCSGLEEYGQTGAVWARYAMPTPKIFGMFSPKDPRRDWFCAGSADGSVAGGTLIEEVASDGYVYVKPWRRGSADSDIRVDSPTQTYLPFLDAANVSVGKFRFTQIGQITTHTKNRHSLSFPLMRMADVYLMYAEAVWYHLSDEEEARSCMRRVLLRACGQDEELTDELMQAYHNDDFVTELLESRERELCFEGTRKCDLFRFNLLDATMRDLVETPIATRNGREYYAWDAYLQFDNKSRIIASSSPYFSPCAESIKSNWRSYKIWAPISSLQMAANPNLKQNARW